MKDRSTLGSLIYKCVWRDVRTRQPHARQASRKQIRYEKKTGVDRLLTHAAWRIDGEASVRLVREKWSGHFIKSGERIQSFRTFVRMRGLVPFSRLLNHDKWRRTTFLRHQDTWRRITCIWLLELRSHVKILVLNARLTQLRCL
jgi:hypothetical protein